MLELSSLSDKLIVRQDGGMLTFQYSFNEPQVAHPGPAECRRNRLDTIDLAALGNPGHCMRGIVDRPILQRFQRPNSYTFQQFYFKYCLYSRVADYIGIGQVAPGSNLTVR